MKTLVIALVAVMFLAVGTAVIAGGPEVEFEMKQAIEGSYTSFNYCNNWFFGKHVDYNKEKFEMKQGMEAEVEDGGSLIARQGQTMGGEFESYMGPGFFGMGQVFSGYSQSPFQSQYAIANTWGIGIADAD